MAYFIYDSHSPGSVVTKTANFDGGFDYGGYTTIRFYRQDDPTKKITIYQFIDVVYSFSKTTGQWTAQFSNSISMNKSDEGSVWSGSDFIALNTSGSKSFETRMLSSIADSYISGERGRTVIRKESQRTFTSNSDWKFTAPTILNIYYGTSSGSPQVVSSPNTAWLFSQGVFDVIFNIGDGRTEKRSGVIYGNTVSYTGATPSKTSKTESGKVTLNCTDPSGLGVPTYPAGNTANTIKTTAYTFNNDWSPALNTPVTYNNMEFTAQFDSSSTWSPASVTIRAASITKPAGYNFIGWNSNKDASSAEYVEGASVSIPVTSADITKTLYAIWKPVEYVVQFITGTSEVLNDITKKYGVNLNLPNDLKRNGYNFQSWNTLKDLSGKSFKSILNEDLSDKDGVRVTLYADWGNPLNNTINYDIGQGTWGLKVPVESFNVEFKNFTVPTPSPLDDSYTFIGWTASADDWRKLHVEVPSTDYVALVNIKPQEITDWNITVNLRANYARTNLYYREDDGWHPVMEVYYNKNGNWVKTQDVLTGNISNVFYNINGQWKN